MMRAKAFASILLLATVLTSAGCVVTQKVYLNQIDVQGPVAAPPLAPRVDPEPATVQLSPRIAFGGPTEFTGRYILENTSVVPRGDGRLTWELPPAQFGLDMLWMTGRNFGVNLGTTLSSVGGSSQSIWRFGLQYSSLNEGVGFALDAGLQWSTLRVRAQTLVITEVSSIFGSSRHVDYFDDTANSTGFGGYLGMTVNSAFRDSRINIFVNGGAVWQPMLGFSAHNRDTFYGPGDYYVTSPSLRKSLVFLSLTPGATLELGNMNRVLVGARVLFPLDIDNRSSELLIQPVVQCSFAL